MSGSFGRGWRALAGCGAFGATAALAVTVALPVTGAAARPAPKRPDLKVSAGSVSASHGRLKGSFVVRNAGAAKAGRSSATLTLRRARTTRVLRSYSVAKLPKFTSETFKVSLAVPSRLAVGSFAIVACADSGGDVRERSDSNNCATVGTLTVSSGTGTVPPGSTVPTSPIAFTADTPVDRPDSGGDYWLNVPPSYDSSGQTPITLFVWMHGCGGESSGDIYTVSPGADRDYISITVGGREDDCWDPNTDGTKIFTAIADVKTHFNINPRRVILGGYSSGGDLAYRTIFYHANDFAGLLAENTSPFRDTGSTQAQSLAAAARKFDVVHLAHLQDTTYPLAGVQNEVNAMQAAGFPITLLTQPGDHYDNPGDGGYAGTDYDLVHYLLPHIDDGWLAPSP
jgi:hypothetical protein